MIRGVYLFEASNSVVVRGLGQAEGKMNKMVGINNHPLIYGGKKWLRLFIPFTRK